MPTKNAVYIVIGCRLECQLDEKVMVKVLKCQEGEHQQALKTDP